MANRIKTPWSKILTSATPWDGAAAPTEVDAELVRRSTAAPRPAGYGVDLTAARVDDRPKASERPRKRPGFRSTEKHKAAVRENIKKAQAAWNKPKPDPEAVRSRRPSRWRSSKAHQAAVRRNIAKANRLRREWWRKPGARAAVERRKRPAGDGSKGLAILGAMRPGEWHAAPELARAAGVDAGTGKAALARFNDRGLVELAQNAEWTATRPYGEKVPPRWLWRITAAGELAWLLS